MFKYSCLYFPPNSCLYPHPSHPHYPPLILHLFGFVHVSFIHVPWQPLSLSPSLSTCPLVTVSLFLISMSLVIFCLLVYFVDYVPIISEITWYFCFTTWLISLSISSPVLSMLSQRVGVPSFFLLHSIPLCKCTIFFWSTHLLMGT